MSTRRDVTVRKLERFFAPLLPDDGELLLDGQEAHHMLHVKRLRPGEGVLLFDGGGREAVARIVGAERGIARLCIERVDKVDREARIPISLAFSVPKGKKAEFLVQKCCELGVRRLIPLGCERSVVKLAQEGSHKTERWRSVALESSKQCGRTYVTEVSEVVSFKGLVEMESIRDYRPRLFASTGPEAVVLSEVIGGDTGPGGVLCIIGPEGGFTEEETEVAVRSGCAPVSLGPRVLRTETAAVALVSILLYAYSA
ncbi:MAG: RsmE family RNA methyltransferase [Planctomycetota bacterium]